MKWDLKRLAPLALIGGLGLASIPLWGKHASERTVVVKVGEPRGLERVELTWWHGDEPVQRTELTGASGETHVRLEDGVHRLEVGVYRNTGVHHEERKIDVLEGSERIVIDLP